MYFIRCLTSSKVAACGGENEMSTVPAHTWSQAQIQLVEIFILKFLQFKSPELLCQATWMLLPRGPLPLWRTFMYFHALLSMIYHSR